MNTQNGFHFQVGDVVSFVLGGGYDFGTGKVVFIRKGVYTQGYDDFYEEWILVYFDKFNIVLHNGNSEEYLGGGQNPRWCESDQLEFLFRKVVAEVNND